MNRKEYELVGNTLWRLKGSIDEHSREQVIFFLATEFAKNYTSFDRDKFLLSCGIK